MKKEIALLGLMAAFLFLPGVYAHGGGWSGIEPGMVYYGDRYDQRMTGNWSGSYTPWTVGNYTGGYCPWTTEGWTGGQVPYGYGMMGPGMIGYGGTLGPGMMGGYGSQMLYYVFWVLVIAVLAVALYLLVTKRAFPRGGKAVEILRERYARGEIGEEEYERTKKKLWNWLYNR